MVVDRDERIVNVLAELLSANGYRVLKALSPEGALERFHAHDPGIDLVLADSAFPGKPGPDFVSELRREQPRVPVVVMSVSAENVSGSFDILPKPFRWSELQSTVARAIASRSAAHGRSEF